ncbi:mRNA (2'-O-methyladenosine-N(6)-)-methyltransferase isoform X1 [Heptranchias perlo]|uniref:mRNA (2'-O-methyladenosine-N(6)-)-methyltransferase isoform X1 n=3 Tax=Heptranchias perlo TaxID=212740 RepID=UPI003559B829
MPLSLISVCRTDAKEMASENHSGVQADPTVIVQPAGTSDQEQPSSPKSVKPVVQDLPDELVQAGWSKCWSRRENRPYYFNKFTNQSLWEMPVFGQHDIISDPLGLNATVESGEGDSAADNGQRKRRHSEETQQHSTNSFKKPRVDAPLTPTTPTIPISPIAAGTPSTPVSRTSGSNSADDKQQPAPSPSPSSSSASSSSSSSSSSVIAPIRPTAVYWDLDIPTNAVIKERAPIEVLPPHPDVEMLRAQLTVKLRQHYQELCQQREGIDPPRDSFNRWLLERKAIDRGKDPLLPSDCDPIVSPSMFREVMNDIPIRLSRIKYREEARKLLFKYAESAKRMIESRNATPDVRKTVKWNVEDTFNWLRKEPSATKEDYMERLEHLRKQCGPHVAAVAKESVEGICGKIYHISGDYVKRVQEKHLALLKECNISEEVERPEVIDRLVYCYPLRLAFPTTPLPRVEMHFENDVACVRYKGEVRKISRNYLSKLEQLYRYSCIDDVRFEKFLARVWCLLRRYQSMFGVGAHEGTGLQGALPVAVFEALNKLFGVTFECFASPLNCYFRQYCSAFPDTDGYFGSRGSFLTFSPVSGSFEANPPFGEELMDSMVTHMEKLLGSSSEPLSFIVFVPEWRNPPTPALVRMEESKFKRHQILAPAYEHEYRSGAQHICKKEDIYYKAVHATALIFLQNDAGFAKWEPVQERVQELQAAYKMTGKSSSSSSSSSVTAGDKDQEQSRDQSSNSEHL